MLSSLSGKPGRHKTTGNSGRVLGEETLEPQLKITEMQVTVLLKLMKLIWEKEERDVKVNEDRKREKMRNC